MEATGCLLQTIATWTRERQCLRAVSRSKPRTPMQRLCNTIKAERQMKTAGLRLDLLYRVRLRVPLVQARHHLRSCGNGGCGDSMTAVASLSTAVPTLVLGDFETGK